MENIDIYAVLHTRLRDFEYMFREIEQTFLLSGANDDAMSRRLMKLREQIAHTNDHVLDAVEDAKQAHHG